MNTIFASLALLCLVFLIYGPWQHACTDYARQEIFRHRDELFDLARHGRLDFKSDTYRATRQHLENIIRYAHELTLPRLLILVLIRKFKSQSLPKQAEISAVSRIEDAETRKAVRKIVSESQRALVYMIIMKSPLTLLFSPFAIYPIVIYKINKKLYLRAVNVVSKLMGVIQFEADGAVLPDGYGS